MSWEIDPSVPITPPMDAVIFGKVPADQPFRFEGDWFRRAKKKNEARKLALNCPDGALTRAIKTFQDSTYVGVIRREIPDHRRANARG